MHILVLSFSIRVGQMRYVRASTEDHHHTGNTITRDTHYLCVPIEMHPCTSFTRRLLLVAYSFVLKTLWLNEGCAYITFHPSSVGKLPYHKISTHFGATGGKKKGFGSSANSSGKKKKSDDTIGKGVGEEMDQEMIIRQQRQETMQSSRDKVESASDATADPIQNNSGSNLDLSPEERGKQLLRNRFGIRSFEEKQAELKAKQLQEKLQKKLDKKREGKDIFQILPPSVIVFIDRFLKAGLAVSTVLFVMAGIGITVEAWSHASGDSLPEWMDTFIVQTVEPNFTPGLFVLLAFSVSLGLFSAAQLGSDTSRYSEK